MSKCGHRKVSLEKTMHDFCEKDNASMRVSCTAPTIEVLAKCWRSSPAGTPGNSLPIHSAAVFSRSSSWVEYCPK
jgi:hypothetical protein